MGLHEKFRLHSVDFLAAMMGFALKSCSTGRRPALRGRTYDLRSAYKQFAVHSVDRASLRMGMNVPGSSSCAMIGFNSLAFGAVGSVAGFLRISQAIWFWDILAWAFFGAVSTMTIFCCRVQSLRAAAVGHVSHF